MGKKEATYSADNLINFAMGYYSHEKEFEKLQKRMKTFKIISTICLLIGLACGIYNWALCGMVLGFTGAVNAPVIYATWDSKHMLHKSIYMFDLEYKDFIKAYKNGDLKLALDYIKAPSPEHYETWFKHLGAVYKRPSREDDLAILENPQLQTPEKISHKKSLTQTLPKENITTYQGDYQR